MKVLHVTPSVARADGGPSEVIRGLIPALQARSVQVHVLSTDKGLSSRDDDIATADWLKFTPSVGPASLTYSATFAKTLRTRIASYDLVHVHGLQSYPGTVAMSIARQAGVPYVIEPHGALDRYHWDQNRLRKRAYARLIDRRNLRGLAGAIFSTELEERHGRRLLPRVTAFRMTLGVDEGLFMLERAPRRESAARVLYLGRITRKKRLDLVLSALADRRLREAGVRLIVAGGSDGSIPDPHGIARALGIDSHVDFLGPVDGATRRRLLSEAAAFVLPSEDESFGIAVAEAMAAGVPVVTTARVGIADEARRDEALRVSANDAASIATELLSALEDGSLGERGREHALNNFRWTLAAAQAEKIYSSVLAKEQP